MLYISGVYQSTFIIYFFCLNEMNSFIIWICVKKFVCSCVDSLECSYIYSSSLNWKSIIIKNIKLYTLDRQMNKRFTSYTDLNTFVHVIRLSIIVLHFEGKTLPVSAYYVFNKSTCELLLNRWKQKFIKRVM